MTVSGRFFEKEVLPKGIDASPKSLVLVFWVNDDDLGIGFYIVIIKQTAFFQFQTAHVEILFAYAVKRGGQVGVAVGQGAAGVGLRGGGGDVALLADGFCVINRQCLDSSAAAVAKTTAGEDADGVCAHRVDVFQDFFVVSHYPRPPPIPPKQYR